MTVLTQLLLISLSVCAHGAPLGELHQLRSDYGVYASDYAKDYEPTLMYAAIPLHRPLPVVHVLSRRPLSHERTHAPSVHHPVYARPPYPDNEYARPPYPDNEYAPSKHNEYEFAEYQYREPQRYGEVPYAAGYEQRYVVPAESASQDDVTILYARPNPHGGFSYRRRPAKTTPKRTPVTTTESPVIIRVHKYRLVRDR